MPSARPLASQTSTACGRASHAGRSPARTAAKATRSSGRGGTEGAGGAAAGAGGGSRRSEEEGADGEEARVVGAVASGVGERVQEAGQEARAHHRPALGEGIHEGDEGRRGPDGVEVLRRDEGVGDGLAEPEGHAGLAGPPAEGLARPLVARGAHGGQRGGDGVEPADAGDLLDEVHLARDVGAEARHLPHVHPGLARVHREPQAREDPLRLLGRDVDAEEPSDAVVPQGDRAARQGLRLEEPLVLHELRPGERAHHRGGARDDAQGVAPVDPALEAVAGLGVHAVAASGPTDAARVEVGALEEHAGRLPVDLAVASAHHAGQAHRPLVVADDQIVVREGALHAVERRELLPGLGPADVDGGAVHAVEVVRVHGVPRLEHHEVGDVDEVRDGADAERGEAPAHVERRGTDLRVHQHRGAIVRAALAVLDGDAHVLREVLLAHDGGRRRDGGLEGDLEEGRGLAREPHVAQAVGPVGRQADLEDGVARGGQRRGERGAGGGGAGREHEDALARVAQPELGLAAEHALAGYAGDGPPLDGHALGRQVRAEGREDHEAAGLGHVGRAADDLLLGAPAVHRDQAQPGARRVGPRGDDGRDEARLGPQPVRPSCPRPRAPPP